jgi:hypothetical protein
MGTFRIGANPNTNRIREESRGTATHPDALQAQSSPPKDGSTMTVGYCLKCKEKREISNAQAITMKNGKPATTGTCPVCSTKMYKIGKA